MAQSGYVGTSKQIKDQLQEMNKDYYGNQTWKQMYSGIDLTRQIAMNDLKYDYASAVNDAYASYLQQNDAITSSNLGQGYKQQLFDDNTLALEQAYDTYKQNYINSLSQLNSSTAQSVQAVDAALTTQAENTSKMIYKPYEYLQALYNHYDEQGLLENSVFFKNDLYKQYITNDGSEEEPQYRLKTWDEIAAEGQRDTATGEWTGMFDKDGNLTVRGVDFYDQMFNAASGTKVSLPFTFDTWLRENDEDLYQWSHEYNPYDYTLAGNNFGSFKTMVGMTSTDYDYSFKERFGGFTENQLNNIFSKVETKATELANTITNQNGVNTKDTIKSYEGLLEEVKTLLTDLDLLEDFEQSGFSFNDFAQELSIRAASSKTEGDLWAEGVGKTLGTIGTGTAAGTAVSGTVAGAVALALGPAGIVPAVAIAALGPMVSAVASTVGGIISSIVNAANAHENNRQIATDVKNQFSNLMNQLITYRQSKRRELEIQQYKNDKI